MRAALVPPRQSTAAGPCAVLPERVRSTSLQLARVNCNANERCRRIEKKKKKRGRNPRLG